MTEIKQIQAPSSLSGKRAAETASSSFHGDSASPEDVHLHQAELRAQNAELRHIQAELQESRDRYFTLYDLAPVGYLTMEQNTTIREINLVGAEMLREPRERLIGTALRKYISTEDLAVLHEHRKWVIERGDRQTCELKLSKNPEQLWIRMASAPLIDSNGVLQGIHSAFMEITVSKIIEEKLAKFHRRDQAFADGAPDIIAMMDRTLKFTYVNPAVERHLGISRESFPGKTPQELGLPASFCSAWNQAFLAVIRSGEVGTTEFEYPSPEGSKYFHVSLVPDTNDPDRIESVVGFMRDFTFLRNAHKELEEEVRQRTAELKSANKDLLSEIGQREKFEKALQFSTAQIIEHSRRRKYLSMRLVQLLEQDRRDMAMALHDQIGQILTTLKMDLELLRKRIPARELHQFIESAIEKASQAMSFSRNISQELRPAMLDTLGLVPSIQSQISRVRETSGLEISFFHRGMSKRLESTKELTIYRILQESLTNILKHASAKNVHITLIRKGNSALLTVEDDGIGFDFRQMTASEKGPLGIMIMKERAVQVGGSVDVESRPGRGTHVAARIPIQEEVQ